ncbi:MAG TPA: WXG100 family type VII secretion target [Candidatus Stackebrandtia excrementipullorum]|nr:WXG100 family type VII secretion target [Candidatus Stackebrandtia excrementipullorum]
MTNLRYDYGGISSATGAIDTFIRKMDGVMDDIEAALKPLEGEAWSGSDAQVAYLEQKNIWREAALAIAQSLVKLKVALNDGAEGIRATDLRAASFFG